MPLYDSKKLSQELSSATEYFQQELKELRTGRAKPEIFENLLVEAYGTKMELRNLASVSAENAVTIRIKPWDSKVTEDVAKAIRASDLGVNPTPTGDGMVINIPPLTEEVRKNTVKEMYEKAEHSKVVIRQIRQKYMSLVEKMEGVSEDEQDMDKKQIQKDIDAAIELISGLSEEKEKELMSL